MAPREQALNLLPEMRISWLEEDVFSYSAAISACEKGQQREQALNLFPEMRSSWPESDVMRQGQAMAARPGVVGGDACSGIPARADQVQRYHLLLIFRTVDGGSAVGRYNLVFFRFWRPVDGGSALGRLARGPYVALGAFWWRPRRSLASQEAAGRKPKRPPNEVGRRHQEETAESLFLQHLFANISNFDAGRPSKKR